MAELYFDEDVARPAARLLQRRGHQVLHARDVYRGAADLVQLGLAAMSERPSVTANRKDFVTLHSAWHYLARLWRMAPTPAHGGILVVPNHLPPAEIADALHGFFGLPPT